MKNLLGSKLKDNVLESEVIYVTNRLADGIQNVCDETTVMIVAGNIVTYMEHLDMEDNKLLNEFYDKYSKMEPKQFIKEAKELLDFIKTKYGIKDSENNIVKTIREIKPEIENKKENKSEVKNNKEKVESKMEEKKDEKKKEQDLKQLFNFDRLNQGAREIMNSQASNIQTNTKPEEKKSEDVVEEKKKREHYTCNICKDPKCTRNPGDRKSYCIHSNEEETIKSK